MSPGAPPGGQPPEQPPPQNPAPTVTIEAASPIPANQALELRIVATDESGLTGIEVAWGDGSDESFALDGSREVELVRHHVYDRVSVFTVTVTAIDMGGSTAGASRTIGTQGGSIEVALMHAPTSGPLLFSARVAVTGTAQFSDRVLSDGQRFVFGAVVPGDQEVAVGNATPGCEVSGPPSTSASVEVGEITVVEFQISCEYTPVERILYQRLIVTGSFFLDNIHTVRRDGSGRTQLTADGGNQFPVWSPDGSRIAWHAVRTDSPQIWIMNWDGGEQRRLTDLRFATAPSWSPDGDRIAFQSTESGNADIWVIGADGSDPVRLTDDPADEGSPHWSPDGDRIAFSVGPPDQAVLHVMDAGGTGRRSLDIMGVSPHWSPDGFRITYHSREDGQVWIVNADGSGARSLTDLPVSTGAPAFTPDGGSVIFHAPRTGAESRLWIVGLDGTDPRLFEAIPDPGVAHATWFAP